MEKLFQVFSPEEIKISVQNVAKRISGNYQNKNLVLVGVLKGSFIFLADLIREISIPCRVDFIRASSYGESHCSSGHVRITGHVEMDLRNTHVILVDDVIDTGTTLAHLTKYLEERGAASVEICVLIDKNERRTENIRADYICHQIQDGFIVGYGMDSAESYRGMPAIYHLKP